MKLRGMQSSQIALNAQTRAQMKVWVGAEVIRQYLLAVAKAGKLAALGTAFQLSSTQPMALSISGMTGINAAISSMDSVTTPTRITVNIQSTAVPNTVGKANSILQVVYDVTNSSVTSSDYQKLQRALSFNGDTSITGGTTEIINSISSLSNIAVNGKLTITSASTAGISGCATDDVYVNGGGVVLGSSLSSQGKIEINQVSSPKSVSLWGKNVTVGNGISSDASFTSIKAGAYDADVLNASGQTIGNAYVGGTLSGTSIVPFNSGYAQIYLTDGTFYLLDLSQANVSQSGNVSQIAQAAKLVSGSGSLPSVISFSFNPLKSDKGIWGGDLNVSYVNSDNLWGNIVTTTGWSGNYGAFWAQQSATLYNPALGSLKIGSSLKLQDMSQPPKISNSGVVGGTCTNMSGTTPCPAISNLQTGVGSSANPGLPGVPYCNVPVNVVDVSSFKNSANYVFYFDSATQHPMLLIQNLKDSSGTAVPAGPYDLTTADLRTIGRKPFMQCNWWADNCFRDTNTTSSKGWSITGLNAFPPGIAWFDGNLNLNNVSSKSKYVYDSLLSTGSITLGNVGSGESIYAPNFADVSKICGGDFFPTNLCSSTSAFKTWTDTSGAVHTGIPLANEALMMQGSLTSGGGWNVYGNVATGSLFASSGAVTTVYGGVSIGNNQWSTTTISAGGLRVNTSGMTTDQLYVAGGQSTTSVPSIKIKWARYL